MIQLTASKMSPLEAHVVVDRIAPSFAPNFSICLFLPAVCLKFRFSCHIIIPFFTFNESMNFISPFDIVSFFGSLYINPMV